jgi:B-cell receptor-associated protein 31
VVKLFALYYMLMHVYSTDTVGGPIRAEVNARKFYSERNMYLCGFTIFLSLILNRTYVMILEQLRLEEELKTLRGDPKAGGKSSQKLSEAGQLGENARLKKDLAKANSDLAAMKKQSEGLQREYNRLGDEKTSTDGTPKKDR